MAVTASGATFLEMSLNWVNWERTVRMSAAVCEVTSVREGMVRTITRKQSLVSV